jgi:hypothetical protein
MPKPSPGNPRLSPVFLSFRRDSYCPKWIIRLKPLLKSFLEEEGFLKNISCPEIERMRLST